MNGTNRKLSLAALLLLAASAATYWNAVSRADRFERGQKLLPHLDPDEVAAIELASEDGAVHLRRHGESFVIAEENDYRAKNEEVNRIVRDLQAVSLAKRVGSGAALAAELGLEASAEGGDGATEADSTAVEVTLKNASGGEMVRLQLGADGENGGTYVRRRDGDDDAIYLTETALRMADTPDRFLDTEILDVPATDVARVEAADFVLAPAQPDEEADEVADEGADDGTDEETSGATSAGAGGAIVRPLELTLVDLPAGTQAKTVELNRLKNLLSGLRFDEVFIADDPEVHSLAFDETLRYELTDGSGYDLQVARAGQRTFLRVLGFHTVERVEIAMDTTEEEMEEKSDILHRAEEIDAFNAFHGSWVYAVDEATAEKLALRRRDLVERS